MPKGKKKDEEIIEEDVIIDDIAGDDTVFAAASGIDEANALVITISNMMSNTGSDEDGFS